ncbi:MAG TPA: hypothetical protein VJU82_05915 [Acidobacteriaceae bacterium]|nr:hypothetical protein [Acidobacteriaceae bacterium]
MLRLLLALVVIAIAGCAASDPTPPHPVSYSVVDEWPIPNGGFSRVIVIAGTSATDAGLRALGDELRYDTRDDRNADIDVFTDSAAAALRDRVFADKASRKDLAFYDRHFVAVYTRNTNTGFNRLSIMPKGLNGPQTDINY